MHSDPLIHRGQLSHVEEQLAQQHSQVRTAQQNQAATPEQICAERIAEQHLRIKQVTRDTTSVIWHCIIAPYSAE